MDRGAWWTTVHGVTKSRPPPKRHSRTHASGHFLQPQQSFRGKRGWRLKLQKETLLGRGKTAHPPHPITLLINKTKNKHTHPPTFKNQLMGRRRPRDPRSHTEAGQKAPFLLSFLSHTFLLRNVSSHPDSLQRRPQPFQPRGPSTSGPETLRCRQAWGPCE